MAIALKDAAQTLQIPPKQLWQESLQAYVSREKRRAQLDAADIQDRYGVSSPQELSQRIKAGEIYSHPAWENLIEWENLLAHMEQLDQLCVSIR